MATVALTNALRDEYQNLFDRCVVDNGRRTEVESLIGKVSGGENRYRSVGGPLGIPWQLVGVIHCLEASFSFKTHLHNGDPLTARTVHVPKGRPKDGPPPYQWEASASDALRLAKLDSWDDWSVPGLLYRLEGYNGFGYRTQHPEVLSPYLWAGSNNYTRGKYVADGTWSATAVSKQCGGAVLLRRMAEIGTLGFDDTNTLDEDPPEDLDDVAPLVRFSATKKSPEAEKLQEMLNRFPGVFVKVDGVPGERTSNAFRKVTGHYLLDDPRA
jgi:lysozyme family protein